MLDCANGATYRVAPRDLRAPRRRGRDDRGRARRAQHQRRLRLHPPRRLAERVAAGGAPIGFAFDGDGDRVLAVDGEGAIHDGDELIALAAHAHGRSRSARRRRRGDRDDQLRLPPGDGGGRDRGRDDPGRRPLRDRGARRRGLEPRRRAVRPHHLDRLRADRRRHRRGADDPAGARRRPPRRRRGRSTSCPRRWSTSGSPTASAIEGAEALWDAVEEENAELEGRGRVLVRPSGTEPLVRVMVEAPTEEEADGGLRAPGRPWSSASSAPSEQRRGRGEPRSPTPN